MIGLVSHISPRLPINPSGHRHAQTLIPVLAEGPTRHFTGLAMYSAVPGIGRTVRGNGGHRQLDPRAPIYRTCPEVDDAHYPLTTPDMLYYVLLPAHARWPAFFSRMRYITVDECHSYRGIFGSYLTHVRRRRQTTPVSLRCSFWPHAHRVGQLHPLLTGLATGHNNGDRQQLAARTARIPAAGTAPVRYPEMAAPAPLLAGLGESAAGLGHFGVRG